MRVHETYHGANSIVRWFKQHACAVRVAETWAKYRACVQNK